MRSNNGAAVPGNNQGIAAGYLNPVKARLRLQLALSAGQDYKQIRSTFEDELLSYIA